MKSIYTDKAPKVVGPYSQAIATEQFIFCAGQIGIDPQTGELVEGIENQVKQAMSNLQEVLKAAGSDFSHVVKTTLFLKNMSDYVKVNELYGGYFSDIKPARSAVEVASLPKGALFEIEAIASL